MFAKCDTNLVNSGRHMGGVDGSAAGAAPEDAENSDTFVRAKRGALARNGILSAESSQKIRCNIQCPERRCHRLWNANDQKALCREDKAKLSAWSPGSDQANNCLSSSILALLYRAAEAIVDRYLKGGRPARLGTDPTGVK